MSWIDTGWAVADDDFSLSNILYDPMSLEPYVYPEPKAGLSKKKLRKRIRKLQEAVNYQKRVSKYILAYGKVPSVMEMITFSMGEAIDRAVFSEEPEDV